MSLLFAASSTDGSPVAGLLVIAVIIGAYFIPSIVAVARNMHNSGTIFVINLFLGWSFIGWVVALAMACGSHRQPVVQQTFVNNTGHAPVRPQRQEQQHAAPIYDHMRQAYVYQDPV